MEHPQPSITIMEAVSPPHNEISWPALFFWLVCFAANAVGQPSGRVCGVVEYKHRALLRMSPIISFFDSLHILAFWFSNLALDPTWVNFRRLAAHILDTRIVDHQSKSDYKAIASLRSHALTRWALFLITVLPQYMKLFAATGASLTMAKILGAMFLCSWLVFELVVAAADRCDLELGSSQNRPLFEDSRLWLAHPKRYSTCVLVIDELLYAGCACRALWPPLRDLALVLAAASTEGGWNIVLAFGFVVLAVTVWPGVAVMFLGFDAETPLLRLSISSFTMVVFGLGSLMLFHASIDRREHLFISRVRVILHVVSAAGAPLAYCIRLYDPAGTTSPPWFEWLG